MPSVLVYNTIVYFRLNGVLGVQSIAHWWDLLTVKIQMMANKYLVASCKYIMYLNQEPSTGIEGY